MRFIDRLKNRKLIKEKLRLQGKGKFKDSVKHAMDGIDYTMSHEKNFTIELVFAIMVCLASIYFKISIIEWAILLITIAIVLALEIMNTAIERCVDLVPKEYEELAKIAKDTSAGAVFVMSLFSVAIGICIFFPKIINLINK